MKIIGHIDEPLNNSTFESDNIFCSGWAFSDKGLKKIKVFIDGVYVGDANYGIIRNDLNLVYPNHSDIEKSGFNLTIKKSLRKGVHRLKVTAFEDLFNQGTDIGEIFIKKGTKKNLFAKIPLISTIFFPVNKNFSPQVENRRRIAERYIFGNGIEIGALHNPLPLKKGVKVRYIDRVPLNELNVQYSELDPASIVKIDVIDNGEILSKIDDESIDFIVANHFIEHCENPLGTIRSHLSKIKSGRILYYAIPEKNFTFDIDRPITTFDHIIADDIQGPSISRKTHMREWATLIEKNQNIDEDELERRILGLVSMNYSIHFHVWDIDAILEMISKSREYLNNSFKMLHFEQNGNEIIVVLQKK
jgi:hypothetical protein